MILLLRFRRIHEFHHVSNSPIILENSVISPEIKDMRNPSRLTESLL